MNIGTKVPITRPVIYGQGFGREGEERILKHLIWFDVVSVVVHSDDHPQDERAETSQMTSDGQRGDSPPPRHPLNVVFCGLDLRSPVGLLSYF